MALQGLPHLPRMLLSQLSRSLDVGEQKRHRPRRKNDLSGHSAIVGHGSVTTLRRRSNRCSDPPATVGYGAHGSGGAA
jgi:hypothetical protein